MSLLESGFGLAFTFKTKGISELRRARDETLSMQRSLERTMKTAQAAGNNRELDRSFHLWTGETRRLRTEQSQLNQAMSANIRAFGGTALAVGGVLSAVGGGGLILMKKSIDASRNFEEVLNSLRIRARVSEDGIGSLREQFKQLAIELPGTPIQMAEAGEVFVKSGTQIKDVIDSTRQAIVLSTAENIQAASAAAILARVNNVFADSLGRVDKPLDRVNSALISMSDATVGTASEISNITLRSGFAAAQLGLTTDQTFALSGALLDMGVRAELGGTAMLQIFQGIKENVGETAKVIGISSVEFEKRLKENAVGVLTEVLAKLAALQKAGKTKQITDIVGNMTGKSGARVTLVLNALAASMGHSAKNADLAAQGVTRLQELLGLASSEFEKGTLASERMSERLKSLNAKLENLNSIWESIKISFGEALTPIIIAVTDALRWIAMKFNLLPQGIKEAIAIMITFGSVAAVSLGGILVFLGTMSFAIASINTQLAAMGVSMTVFEFGKFLLAKATLAMTRFTLRTVLAQAAVWGLNAAIAVFKLLTNPIFLGISLALIGIVTNIDRVKAAFVNLFTFLGGLFSAFSSGTLSKDQYDLLESMGLLDLASVVATLGKMFDGFFHGFKEEFMSVFKDIQPLFEQVGKMITDFFGIFTPRGDNSGIGSVREIITLFENFGRTLGFVLKKLVIFAAVGASAVVNMVKAMASAINGIGGVLVGLTNIFGGKVDIGWEQIKTGFATTMQSTADFVLPGYRDKNTQQLLENLFKGSDAPFTSSMPPLPTTTPTTPTPKKPQPVAPKQQPVNVNVTNVNKTVVDGDVIHKSTQARSVKARSRSGISQPAAAMGNL